MGRGRRLRRGSEPTRTTNLDGIFTLNECADYIAEDKWPTIPDAVSDLAVTGGDGTLDLSWSAPSSNGLPFSLYIIEYTPSGGSATTVTTSNTSYQITGLTNDTEYSVRVGAIVGDRVNYSAAVTGTPVAAVTYNTTAENFSSSNDGPSLSVISPQSTSIQLVAFVSPDVANQSVTGFTQLYRSHTSGWGVTVFYRESPPSSTTVSFTNQNEDNLAYYEIKDAPPVSNWVLESTTGSNYLSDTIESSTNDLVVGVMFKQDDDDSDQIGAAVGWTQFNKASNPRGWIDLALGSYRSVSDGTTPALGFTDNNNTRSAILLINIPSSVVLLAPAQTTGLAVDSTGDGTIDLSWTAPASNVAITDYRIEYTPSGSSATEVLVGSAATSYQLTGLTNDTEYSVRVAAVSAGGQGDYSAAVTGTPSAALAAPANLREAACNDGDATIAWDAVSGASSYRLEISTDNSSWSLFANTASTSVIWGSNGDRRYFRVAAVDSNGVVGSFSNSISEVCNENG